MQCFLKIWIGHNLRNQTLGKKIAPKPQASEIWSAEIAWRDSQQNIAVSLPYFFEELTVKHAELN